MGAVLSVDGVYCFRLRLVGLGTSSSTLETVGYSLFAAIFNVGWAATQVSHM